MAVTAKTGSAAEQLEALDARRRTLGERLAEIDAEQRAAAETFQQVRAALVAVERSGDATDKAIADAKKALAAAATRANDPEPPARIEGIRLAIADVNAETTAFVREHLAELVGPLEDEATAAAREVDRAAGDVIRAYQERNAVDQRLHALLARAGVHVEPGVVVRTRGEALYREATVLLVDGEAAPLIDRVRARQHPQFAGLVAALDAATDEAA